MVAIRIAAVVAAVVAWMHCSAQVHAGHERFTAVVERMSAWCDHMPGGGAPRQHLKISVRLTNTGDRPFRVALDEARVSFTPGERGDAVRGMRVAETGTVILEGHETRTVELRAQDAFPKNRHDRTLHATLVFAGGGERVRAQASATVQRTD